MRFTTIKEIDRAGFDLRLWCFDCARGATIDGSMYVHFEQRGLPLRLDQVRRYFPCTGCGARDCLIVPASPQGPRPKDATGWAVTMFFANRKFYRKAQKPRRDRE